MSSPFLAKFFITQVLLFQPITIHGFLYKECPWILSSNEEPFFIALMTPLLSWFGYSYTEFSYRIVHLCTGRLPMGLASQSVTQQEDTYPCSYTGHNASLQLSISTRHCSTGRAQTNTHYQPAPGLCSPVAVPIWLGDRLGGSKGKMCKTMTPSVCLELHSKHILQ